MTSDELQKLVDGMGWSVFGQGSYHAVGRSKIEFTVGNYTGLWVYKRRLDSSLVSDPSRAVRKWNMLNPEFPAWRTRNGWIAPYFEGEQASDLQIAPKLVEIYLLNRNIIADAAAIRNFLACPDGRVVCVDVDLSLRRGSAISNTVNRDLKDFAEHFAATESDGFVDTVAIIKNLFYLERELDEKSITNDFISYRTILSLTRFRSAGASLTRATMRILAKIVALDESNELHSQFFSPEYINELLALNALNPIESKAQLFELIAGILSKNSNPAELIKANNLDAIKFLIMQNPAFLTRVDDNGLNLLHNAAANGCLEIASYLIEQGIGVNEASPADSSNPNMRPVDFAILFCAFDTVQLLLEKGAIVSPEYTTHLHYLFSAAWSGRLDLVQSLILVNPGRVHSCDNAGYNALLWAASKGQEPVVDFLLNHGAILNHASKGSSTSTHRNYTALDWAVAKGHSGTIRRLLRANAKMNHRHQRLGNQSAAALIMKHDLENLKLLLAINPDLLNHIFDRRGHLPLHTAAHYGLLEFVTYLVNAGAGTSTRAREASQGKPPYCDMIPLEIAMIREHVETARFLLERTYEMHRIVDRTRAMFFAAKYGFLPLMKVLVTFSSELLHVTNANNQTPLTFAAALNQLEIVRYLISMQVHLSPISKNEQGFFHSRCPDKHATPLDLAILEKHWAVVDLLVAAGARANIYSAEERLIKVPGASTSSEPACSSSFGHG